MNRYRNVILLVVIGIVPVIAALVVVYFFLDFDEQPEPAPPDDVVAEAPEEVETHPVVAATRALPVGTLLGDEDLSEIELEVPSVRLGHIRADERPGAEGLRGHVVRVAVAAGEPLTRSALIAPGQRGFLAAVLEPGTRAVTIELEEEVRQAALIDPGDRVDVILTAAVARTDDVVTRIILEDVRVVAIDRVTPGEAATGEDGAPIERGEIMTATLEVLPAQAAQLALGKNNGRLSLAVRSLAAPAAAQDSVVTVGLRDLLTPPEDPPTRVVFAATRRLPAGTLLGDGDLRELELERSAVRPGHILADEPSGTAALRGHVVRKTLSAGAALTREAVIGPRQAGFLAAVLKPGRRAVTVRLEAAEGRHAGLISPDDRVDVILTASLESGEGAGNALTRTIIEDLRVVAVDRGGDAPGDAGTAASEATIVATLEALPMQAAQLAHGNREGRLTAVIRSPVGAAQDSVATVGMRDLLTPPEDPPTRMVFAAARRLPAGTLLGDGDLRELELERSALRPGHILADEPSAAAALHGHVVRKTLSAGAPFTREAVIGPRQAGFLAAVLRPGRRAVTVRLEAAEGRHAGLIGPGDRVDVILTASLAPGEGAGNVLTRTIIEDVRVVAVDRGGDASGDAGEVASETTIVATLEALPTQATQLTHANREGRLTAVVRSPGGSSGARATVGLRELLFAAPEEVTKERGAKAAETSPTRTTVRVIRGDQLTEEGFSYRR